MVYDNKNYKINTFQLLKNDNCFDFLRPIYITISSIRVLLLRTFRIDLKIPFYSYEPVWTVSNLSIKIRILVWSVVNTADKFTFSSKRKLIGNLYICHLDSIVINVAIPIFFWKYICASNKKKKHVMEGQLKKCYHASVLLKDTTNLKQILTVMKLLLNIRLNILPLLSI